MFIKGETVYIESATEWIRTIIDFVVRHRELRLKISTSICRVNIDECKFVTIDDMKGGCVAINIHRDVVECNNHIWEAFIGYFGVVNGKQLMKAFGSDVSHVSFLFDCSSPFDASTEEFDLVRDFINAVAL